MFLSDTTFSMLKPFCTLLLILTFDNFSKEQLLNWSPAFPKETDQIISAPDVCKGNKGLPCFAGNVNVETGFLQPVNYSIKGLASDRSEYISDSFSFILAGTTEIKPLPPGVRPGINREPGDTSIILALVAPGKSKVSVIGDFSGSDWKENINYQMNLDTDNKTWWLRIQGLLPTAEYGFQYLVDGNVKVTDPYVEKILDPVNDPFISSATYPNLKSYPSGKTNGIVGVIEPRSGYQWKNNFSKPDKSSLVIYELLMRDFLSNHDFTTLMDTLNYLSKLGINAIELMPVSEFEGNQSWGYNPNFFFAVDKYYGTETSFKRFIDSCHGRGIAVIMDMVLNHATGTCPLAALYWDGVNQRPAADNPWFNVTATHPFSVFNDFNHESFETKYFANRVMEYWLKEYKIDGYRFDLSKGFTQKNNPNNVGAWSAYDLSRINIWRQYYDSIQKYSPNAYVILEHFADDAEEKVLSDAGMMLWGNSNASYNEATMGYLTNSDFSRSLYQARSWSEPNLVSYMESHDEERLMYKNLQFGNSLGAYNTRNLATALDRMKLAASFFLMSPGPKMIWQFGELGFDYSINRCTNGNVDNGCRLDNKPIVWNYFSEPNRKSIYEWYAQLLNLRKAKSWQSASKNINFNLTSAIKSISFKENSDLNVIVTGNFDVKSVTGAISFPKTGNWIDLKDGKTISINQLTTTMTFQPGEYHVYLDRPLDQIISSNKSDQVLDFSMKIVPNPSNSKASISFVLNQAGKVSIKITSLDGRMINLLKSEIMKPGDYLFHLPNDLIHGTYLITMQNHSGIKTLKWMKY